jgi:hypothetical protein
LVASPSGRLDGRTPAELVALDARGALGGDLHPEAPAGPVEEQDGEAVVVQRPQPVELGAVPAE